MVTPLWGTAYFYLPNDMSLAQCSSLKTCSLLFHIFDKLTASPYFFNLEKCLGSILNIVFFLSFAPCAIWGYWDSIMSLPIKILMCLTCSCLNVSRQFKVTITQWSQWVWEGSPLLCGPGFSTAAPSAELIHGSTRPPQLDVCHLGS